MRHLPPSDIVYFQCQDSIKGTGKIKNSNRPIKIREEVRFKVYLNRNKGVVIIPVSSNIILA